MITIADFKQELGKMFSTREEQILKTVHPDLVKVMRKAKEMGATFRVVQGTRSLSQQRENVAAGRSWTMRSRHLPSADGLARAVDIVPVVGGKVSTIPWPPYYELAPKIKAAARACGIDVEWGGDWRKTKDGPHWQLPRAKYP